MHLTPSFVSLASPTMTGRLATLHAFAQEFLANLDKMCEDGDKNFEKRKEAATCTPEL